MKDRRILRSAGWIGLGLLAVSVVVGALSLLLGPVASYATSRNKDHAAAINATRQVLLATAAGLAALTGLGFTGRTFYLSRRGQLTDRYTKAIAQLASDKLTERLGGIYALEHLMRESARDHETVVDVLAAFVRECAPAKTSAGRVVNESGVTVDVSTGRPRTDVQAAMTVLGRRPHRPESNGIDLSNTNLCRARLLNARLNFAFLGEAQLQNADLGWGQLQRANLAGAQLQDADLFEAQLQRADLTEAQLQRANLFEAHLQRANLFRAQLQDADLGRAQLQGANLAGAQLQGADLREAQLQGANFSGTQLQGANLSGARLTNADGSDAVRFLTSAQLATTTVDHTTLIPADLRAEVEGSKVSVDSMNEASSQDKTG